MLVVTSYVICTTNVIFHCLYSKVYQEILGISYFFIIKKKIIIIILYIFNRMEDRSISQRNKVGGFHESKIPLAEGMFITIQLIATMKSSYCFCACDIRYMPVFERLSFTFTFLNKLKASRKSNLSHMVVLLTVQKQKVH